MTEETPGALLVKEYDALKAEQGPWESLWQELADWVQPRKANIIEVSHHPDAQREARVFDNMAARANEKLASGLMAWMLPFDSQWAKLLPPHGLREVDDAVSWYAECSEVMFMQVVAQSNFYEQAHEALLDRSGFGTAVLHTEEDAEDIINFDCWDIGEYCIAEDKKGRVDTVFRKFELTADQAEKKYGAGNLPEKITANLEDPGKRHTKHEFLHAIKPRKKEEREGKIGAAAMPWKSCIIACEGKHLVSEGGFNELPTFVTRHLKWQRSPYGYCPAWRAMADTRVSNKLGKYMLALAEVAAFPRMLIPADFTGRVDVSGHGATPFDPARPASKPEEWLTGGRYDIGLDQQKRLQDAIEDSYNLKVFQMFADNDKQMTATEVIERRNEKISMFSPTIGRLQSELLDPLIERIFAICARRSLPNWMMGADGLLPMPPQSVIDYGGGSLPAPQIDYQSRLALALRDYQSAGFVRTLEASIPLLETQPDILDNLKLEEGFRMLARNNGVPEELIRVEAEVEQIKEQRAQQAQAQQAMELAASGA